MKLVDKISLAALQEMASEMYDNLVKAVVDVEDRLMVVDAGLHSDEETFLLELGSQQANLWGINLYPDLYGSDDFIEFDSIINVRPLQQNRSRDVENEVIRQRIVDIVSELVHG